MSYGAIARAMDALRVNISYRSFRIAWAIRRADFDAFRQAVRMSHALWGGFNPIVVVDREEEATDRVLDPAGSLPVNIRQLTISTISRGIYGDPLAQRVGSEYPGFFLGNSADLDDLVWYWNLRAAGVSLVFVDIRYRERCGELVAKWEQTLREGVSSGASSTPHTQPYGLGGKTGTRQKSPLGDFKHAVRLLDEKAWIGSIRPSAMFFGEASTLGVVGRDQDGKPKVSFALSAKPFCAENRFHFKIPGVRRC